MNQHIKREATWAFLAGLFECAGGGVYVKKLKHRRSHRFRIALKIRLQPAIVDPVIRLLTDQGIRATGVKLGPFTGVCVMDQGVTKVLCHMYDYLLTRKEEAQLAFRFNKTKSHTGIHLDTSQVAERSAVYNELRDLHRSQASKRRMVAPL